MNLHFVELSLPIGMDVVTRLLKLAQKRNKNLVASSTTRSILKKFTKKCEAYTKELEFKNKSWKKQVEDWCIYAMRGLEEIIVCRIPQGYNGCPPTEAEVKLPQRAQSASQGVASLPPTRHAPPDLHCSRESPCPHLTVESSLRAVRPQVESQLPRVHVRKAGQN